VQQSRKPGRASTCSVVIPGGSPCEPGALFEAIVAQLLAREDRDLDARLFPGWKGSALRTAITRSCRLTGTPSSSPHELRKRRGSLLGKQGYSLAEIAERLGDTKVVAAEHYLYAIGDYAEVEYAAVLSC
jgi:integrase